MENEKVVTALKAWKDRVKLDKMYRDYYDGNHYIVFASKSFRDHYRWVLQASRENMCEGVVGAFTGPIGVKSWQGGGGKTATELAKRWKFPRLMNQVHDESWGSGDAFVLVWDNDRGEAQPYFHTSEQMVVVCYPGTNEIEYAAKVFISGTTPRVTLYFEDRAERFMGTAKADSDDVLADLDTLWPARADAWLPYDGDDGEPVVGHNFGQVPVKWFPHNQRKLGGRGTSILRNVIPLQDGLNHSLASLIVGGEAFAQPLRLLLGTEPEGDQIVELVEGVLQTRQPEGIKIDPTKETIVEIPGKDAKAFQFDPPDATKLIAVQDAFALKIARVVGLPNFDLTQASGDVPSGAALRILRERKTSRITDYLQDVEGEWMSLLELLGAPDAEVEWNPVDKLDPIEEFQVLESKYRMGWPFEELLIDAGEQPDDIERILGKKAEEQARQQALFEQGRQNSLRLLQGGDDEEDA